MPMCVLTDCMHRTAKCRKKRFCIRGEAKHLPPLEEVLVV